MAKSAAPAAKKDTLEPIAGDFAGDSAAPESMGAPEGETRAVTGSPDAANDQSIEAVHAPEVQTAIDAVSQEIDDAVAVIEQGADQLELKQVQADDGGRPKAKKRLTPQQGAKVAQRRLAEGERLLLREAIGVAHVKVDMTIKHSQLANLFKRAYPMCDVALYTINRHGDDNLGSKEARVVIELLEKMTSELRLAANETYTVALGLFTEEKKTKAADGDVGFTALTYIAAYDGSVTARSPQANQLLHCFKVIDAAMCELENLHWSGSRSYSEIDDEFLAVKSKVNRIADLARRTVYAIRRNHNEVFGATQRPAPVALAAAA